MLKKPLSGLVGLLLLAQSAAAQMPIRTTNIYFDTNADSLDQNARYTLDSLAQAAKNWGQYQTNIVAYTDDRGSDAQNLALAQRRAASVNNYLTSTQFASSQTEVKAAGELKLKGKSDPETARREMRRVEIRVQYQNPQDVSDLFNYFSQKEQQFITIADPRQPQIIKGKKGTRISIPANSLVRPDGRPAKGPVQVELREAYTFGDMLAQNLGTTSGKELLQTGGMFFIEAKDADGQILDLAKGQKAEISMPQSQPLPEGMQIFVADRAGDHNEDNIDWQATNQPFTRPQRGAAEREVAHRDLLVTIPTTKHDREQLEKSSDFLSKGAAYETYIPKTTAPKPADLNQQHLAKPTPNLLRLPNEDRIAKDNPRLEGEGRKAYRQRLKSIHKQESTTYDSLLADNRAKEKAYQQAQSDIYKQRQSYTKASKRYDEYTDSLALALATIYKHYQGSAQYAYARSWAVSTRQNWLANYDALNQRQPLNLLGQQTQDNRFADLLQQQAELQANIDTLTNQLNAYGLASIQKLFPQDFTMFDSLLRQPIFVGMINFYGHNSQSVAEIAHRLKSAYPSPEQFVREATQFLSEQAAKLHQQSRFSEFQGCLKAYYESPLIAFGTQVDSINAKMRAISQAHRARCLDFGLLTDGDARQAIAAISKFGWVNCDKFLQYPPNECIHFTLNHRNDMKTQFFIVVPSIASIVPLHAAPEGFVCRQYNGIPKHLQAKLVGIRVENGQPAIFVAENTVQALQSSKVNFKNCSIADAKKAIAAL